MSGPKDLPTASSLGGAGRGLLRQRKHTAKVIIGLITLGLAVLYTLTVVLIGSSVEPRRTPPQPPPGGIAVSIVEVRISPSDPLIQALVIVQPDSRLVTQNSELREPLTLSLWPTLGGELYYRAGARPTSQDIEIPLEGDVEYYPFDTYRGIVNVQATVGSGKSARAVAIDVTTALRDPGWQQRTTRTVQGSSTIITEELLRARSTKAISILLLAFMVALGIVAGIVAAWATAGMIEAAIGSASWLAALLFALLPLRNFLPGSPPVGSWIDILVFFWVEIVIMASMLTVLVTMLIRSKRDAEEHAEEEAT